MDGEAAAQPDMPALQFAARAKGSRKITSHFHAPMHPAWQGAEAQKYLDIPVLRRLARQAPQHLKM